jgi:hypothetical protein
MGLAALPYACRASCRAEGSAVMPVLVTTAGYTKTLPWRPWASATFRATQVRVPSGWAAELGQIHGGYPGAGLRSPSSRPAVGLHLPGSVHAWHTTHKESWGSSPNSLLPSIRRIVGTAPVWSAVA